MTKIAVYWPALWVSCYVDGYDDEPDTEHGYNCCACGRHENDVLVVVKPWPELMSLSVWSLMKCGQIEEIRYGYTHTGLGRRLRVPYNLAAITGGDL